MWLYPRPSLCGVLGGWGQADAKRPEVIALVFLLFLFLSPTRLADGFGSEDVPYSLTRDSPHGPPSLRPGAVGPQWFPRFPCGNSAYSIFVAGVDGSRTHRGRDRSHPPTVLKTAEPTGAQPPPFIRYTLFAILSNALQGRICMPSRGISLYMDAALTKAAFPCMLILADGQRRGGLVLPPIIRCRSTGLALKKGG